MYSVTSLKTNTSPLGHKLTIADGSADMNACFLSEAVYAFISSPTLHAVVAWHMAHNDMYSNSVLTLPTM